MRASRISSSSILAVILAGSLAGAGLFVPARPAAAADVELPPRIPTAKVVQQVGLTEIAVEYDRPATQGRKIWGNVVAYDRPWTIGGRAGTKVDIAKEVRVGDRVVPPGSYWLLALPGKTAWTLMLNKGAEPGGPPRAYQPELDVARVKVAPRAAPRRERLLFTFSDVTDDRASLDLEWDAVRVSLPIQVNTTQQILTSISGLDGTWRAFANAARYMLETTRDYDAGLRYIDQALALKDDWYCMWIKGALMAAKGDHRAAREWALKARDLSRKAGDGASLAPELDDAIAEWTRKSGVRVGGDAPASDAQAAKKAGDGEGQGASRGVSSALPAEAPAVPSVAAPAKSAPAAMTAEKEAAHAPALEAASHKEGVRAPAGDPPLVRRARLRRR